MPRILQLRDHLQRLADSSPTLADRDDAPAQDEREPEEFSTQRYAAWSATAIYGFVPFSAPPGR